MEIDRELEDIHAQIMGVHRAEDLFGADDVILPVKNLLDFLTVQFNKVRASLNPQGVSNIEESEMVEEALQKLDSLYRDAQERIKRYHYGMLGFQARRPSCAHSFTVGDNLYFLGTKLSEGDFSSRYQGYLEREGLYLGEVEILLSRESRFNYLVQREARSVDLLHKTEVPQWKHLPLILDRFESGGRTGLIYRRCYGLTLSDVRQCRAQVKGVDQRHMVWMLDRSLSCLGYVHRCGIVHGNINPDSIVINDRLHNVFLKNWEYSVHNPARTLEKIELETSVHNPFVSPEVRKRGAIGPWSDVYSLGKTLIWLIGGDPTTNAIPNQVEQPIKNFLLEMVKEEHSRRSADCWELYEEQIRIKDSLWERQFLHFDVT